VGVDVVDARRGSILLDTEEPMLSLVTCYPFDAAVPGGPMRYVVTAAMIY
jgi:sortase A